MSDFDVEGGRRPAATGIGGPDDEFDDEDQPGPGLHRALSLVMANAGIQGGRRTNGSQFFITTVPTTWLQGKHTIFGDVTDEASRAVVDSLNAVATDMRDKPLEDVVIRTSP